jgi:glycosyltransferase involved in cell wall biosynthesis
LTVLVPAYNEGSGLARTIEDELRPALGRLGVTTEILIVDDASRDDTGAVADRLAGTWADVRVVHHAVNAGIGAGLRTGFGEALGEWLILVPADLAIELDDLAVYVAAAEGADVVVGVTNARGDYTRYRQWVHRLNIALIRALFGMPFRQFNYISMYRLDAVRPLQIRSWQSAFFFAEILIEARDRGARLVEVDARYRPRESGEATGANTALIGRTARDMIVYWLGRTWRSKRSATAR